MNKTQISAKNQRLMRKWDRRLKVTEATMLKQNKSFGLDKKVALAASLENTKNLLEATQPANIGQYKRYSCGVSVA